MFETSKTLLPSCAWQVTKFKKKSPLNGLKSCTWKPGFQNEFHFWAKGSIGRKLGHLKCPVILKFRIRLEFAYVCGPVPYSFWRTLIVCSLVDVSGTIRDAGCSNIEGTTFVENESNGCSKLLTASTIISPRPKAVTAMDCELTSRVIIGSIMSFHSWNSVSWLHHAQVASQGLRKKLTWRNLQEV